GGLAFDGKVNVQAFDAKLAGRGALALDAVGDFERGALELTALDTFEVVPGVLALSNPGFTGKVAKGGQIDLSLFSDIKTAFSMFDLDIKRAHVGYQKGKGHSFAGGADKLVLK